MSKGPSAGRGWAWKRSHGLGILFLGLLLVLGDAFTGGKVLGDFKSDLVEYFLPAIFTGFSELRKGHWMLWNPYLFGGSPFLGDSQTALLYPPHYLNLFLPLNWSVNLEIFLHLLAAGYFFLLWALNRNLSYLAGITGAFLFILGGPFFLNIPIGHFASVCAIAWIPLMFYAADLLLAEASWKGFLLGTAGLVLQILSGELQIVFFTMFVLLLYVAGVLWMEGNKPKTLAAFGAVLFSAGALTAVQWLTTWGAMAQSARGGALSPEAAGLFSLPPESLLSLLLPNFFGGAGDSPYWGRWYFSETCLFMGVGGFWLAGLAFFTSGGGRLNLLKIMMATTLLLALGAYTPFFHVLYRFIPGFDHLRGYGKFSVLFQFFAASLAAHGLDRVWKGGKASGPWPHAPALAALGLGFLGFYFLEYSDGFWGRFFTQNALGREWLGKVVEGRRTEFLKVSAEAATGALLLAAGVCLAYWLVSTGLRDGKRKAFGLAALAVVELLFFARTHRPTFALGLYEGRLRAVQDFLQAHPGDYRVVGNFLGNNLEPWGRDIGGIGPVIPRRHVELIAKTQDVTVDDYLIRMRLFRKFPPALGLLRPRYVLSDEGDHLGVYPLSLPEVPRVQFVEKIRRVPDEASALREVTAPGFDPRKEVVVEGSFAFPRGGRAEGGAARWEVLDRSTESLEIKAFVGRAGLLVIGETFDKGWAAYGVGEDRGKKFEVVPADLILRAVPLEPGNHHFVMVYRPREFVVGKWISLFSAGLLLLAVLWFRAGRGKAGKARKWA